LWSLTEQKVRTLKKLGLSEVFIGLETTDTTVNRWSGHHVTHELAFKTIQRLQDYGITVCIPFIFGLPGESRKSLSSSESLACDLVERFDNIRMVLVSLGIPLIGSRWFDQLCSLPAVRRSYRDGDLTKTDCPDYSQLLECSVDRLCGVAMGEIVDTVHRIRDRLAMRVSVGWFGDLDRTVRIRSSRALDSKQEDVRLAI